MKSILYYLSIIIFSIGCFCACDQDNCFTTEPNDSINSTLIEEAEYLCLPIDVVKNLSPEAKQSRISSFIIAEHISIQGSEQRINITEEEALKLGVPSHHYRYAENYLNSLNQLTKNSKDIINIKEYVQEAKRRKYYCPTANTKSNVSRGAIRDDYLVGVLESDYRHCGRGLCLLPPAHESEKCRNRSAYGIARQSEQRDSTRTCIVIRPYHAHRKPLP